MTPKPPTLNLAALRALATALDAGVTVDRADLAAAARSVCAELALRHPGRSIELRVPPFAAVQLGLDEAGAQHRRGTPPNVVELSPETLVALAVGTLSWDDAIATHRVRASGIRSDVGAVFPLAG